MSMLKAKIAALFDKIGRTNGTAPQDSQDTLDLVAHEYNVASVLYSIAEKRKENAKAALIASLTTNAATSLDKKKIVVKTTEISDRIDLGSGQHYATSAHVKIGATFLDDKALTVDLMKIMGTDAANELINKHRKRRDPSVTYEVVELAPE